MTGRERLSEDAIRELRSAYKELKSKLPPEVELIGNSPVLWRLRLNGIDIAVLRPTLLASRSIDIGPKRTFERLHELVSWAVDRANQMVSSDVTMDTPQPLAVPSGAKRLWVERDGDDVRMVVATNVWCGSFRLNPDELYAMRARLNELFPETEGKEGT